MACKTHGKGPLRPVPSEGLGQKAQAGKGFQCLGKSPLVRYESATAESVSGCSLPSLVGPTRSGGLLPCLVCLTDPHLGRLWTPN